MNLESIVFILVAGTAFGYSGYKIKRLIQLAKAHKLPLNRFDHIKERLISALYYVIGQKAVTRKKYIGTIHAVIFWGFIIISIGTLEQFASTLIAGASFEFLGNTLYSALLFTQDFFTFAVLLGVLMAAHRRLIVRPKHLSQSADANLILVFTGALMISIFLMNAFHILGLNPWYQSALPFSSIIASALSPFNFDQESASFFGHVFKWIHMLIVLGFAMYIPSSKHLHVLAAGPNTFFKPQTREKPMRSINFEDESIEQYGAAKITDLSWKDALDYYSCTECGRCQELCPAWNTEKPLSPMKIVKDLRNQLFANTEKVLKGQHDELPHVIDENVTEDVIWACTSCRACEIACPVFIEHTDKIYDIRKNLVMMESRFPKEVQTVFKNMETNATPWAFSPDSRADWAKEAGVKTIQEEPNPEYLLWVGCAGSFDDRNKKVLQSFSNILKKANIKFSILGTEEMCTGDPARRIGNEFLFQTLAKQNIENLNNHGIKKIVTSCPHCFNTLKNEYKEFGGNYEVIHHSQLILELIQGGKIKPTQPLAEKVTFHDSCYLGRWNDVYQAPREILNAIPSTDVVEMKSHHDQSLCCGAGGGRMWMEETIGKRVNITRTEQALETKASVVASGCPFCMTMITDGLKSKDMQDKVKIKDLAEIVDESLA